MKSITKDGKGKIKLWEAVVDEGIYPKMNQPGDTKSKKLKLRLRRCLLRAWENGVSDGCIFICHIYVANM